MAVGDALAAMAMGAAKVPKWKKPDATTFGPPITSQTQEDQYHPRVAAVQASMANLTTAQLLSVLQARLTWVRQRQAAAQAALTGLKLSPNLPDTIPLSSVPVSDWPLKGKLRVNELSYRLRTGQQGDMTRGEDFSTDLAYAALTDQTVLTTAAGSAATAAAMLLQMRCLADIYGRWEVGALLTAGLAGLQFASPPLGDAQMLARILTYWRIEGDLSLPPEADTLTGTDPGALNAIALPPGRTRFKPFLYPSAYLYCVTYLAQPQPMPYIVQKVQQIAQLNIPSTMTAFTDSAFTLVLGGLDILWNPASQTAAEQLFVGENAPPNGFIYTDEYDWPGLNRQVPGSNTEDHTVARISAQGAYAKRFNLLVSSNPLGPAGTQAVRTSPIGAANYAGSYSGAGGEYASLALSEGVRYLNRLSSGPQRFGATAMTPLPEILVYLLFHMGAKSKGMLASAAAAALLLANTTSGAKALKLAITDALPTDPTSRSNLISYLKQVHAAHDTANNQQSVNIATTHWDTIGPLLGSAQVAPAMASYLRHEPLDKWHGWHTPGNSPRGNCIGYAQLFEYLSAQIQ